MAHQDMTLVQRAPHRDDETGIKVAAVRPSQTTSMAQKGHESRLGSTQAGWILLPLVYRRTLMARRHRQVVPTWTKKKNHPTATIYSIRKAIQQTTHPTPRSGLLSRQRTTPPSPLIPLACGSSPSFLRLLALPPTYFSLYDTLALASLLLLLFCLCTLLVYYGTNF